MEAKLKAILKNLPAKKPRSRLEPYRELIREMRRRGRSYREIIQVLQLECDLEVSVSTLHDFVRLRSRSSKQKASASVHAPATQTKAPMRSAGDSKHIQLSPSTQRSIQEAEGNARPQRESKETRVNATTKKTLFQYDPDEPLRIPAQHGTKKSNRDS